MFPSLSLYFCFLKLLYQYNTAMAYSSSGDLHKEKNPGKHQGWKGQDKKHMLCRVSYVSFFSSIVTLSNSFLKGGSTGMSLCTSGSPSRTEFCLYHQRRKLCRAGFRCKHNRPSSTFTIQLQTAIRTFNFVDPVCLKLSVKSLAFLSPLFPVDIFSQKLGGCK